MNRPAAKEREVEVWDLPLRVFHWVLLLLVIGSFVTQYTDNLELHAKFGYAVLSLLIFRLLWGFVGGTHARFASFVKGPAAIRSYLAGMKSGAPSPMLGHNPLGALSVLALLLVLLAQAGSGLFTSTDEFFEGPLAKLVSGGLSHALTEFHEFNANVLWLLVGLHLAAVLFYRFVKRDNLILPMLSGKKRVSLGSPQQDAAGGNAILGLIVLAISAGVVWYLVTRL